MLNLNEADDWSDAIGFLKSYDREHHTGFIEFFIKELPKKYLVLPKILAMSAKYGFTFFNIVYLESTLRLNRRAIDRELKRLEDEGQITRVTILDNNNGKVTRIYPGKLSLTDFILAQNDMYDNGVIPIQEIRTYNYQQDVKLNTEQFLNSREYNTFIREFKKQYDIQPLATDKVIIDFETMVKKEYRSCTLTHWIKRQEGFFKKCFIGIKFEDEE